MDRLHALTEGMEEAAVDVPEVHDARSGDVSTARSSRKGPQTWSLCCRPEPSVKGHPTPDDPRAPLGRRVAQTLREVRGGWGTRRYFSSLLRTQGPPKQTGRGRSSTGS